MSPLIEVEGLREVMQAMKAAREKLHPEVEVMMAEATLPLLEAVASYPSQPPPKDEKHVYLRGQGTKYVPTGKIYYTSQQYGKTAHQFTRREGSDVVAGVGMPATYAVYLRGDMDTGSKRYNKPAWMHNGVWETLVSIANRLLPNIIVRFDMRIGDFLRKIGLSR